MSKPVEISHSQWNNLLTRLREEYSPSVVLLTRKMKSKLGFTPRTYKDWDDSIGKYGGWRKNCVMLDFYSEKKRTWFLMKYSDYIQKESVDDDF